ncbi:MAG: hypothetical protein Q8P42_00990 [Gallionella sp.]|nr:hypothetical protein [Gallionella sp.]
MKRLFAAVAVFIIAPIALAEEEPLEIKGISFGASETQFIEKNPTAECKNSRDEQEAIMGDRICRLYEPDGTTYAGVPANISVFFFADKMDSALILLNSKDFNLVKSALILKYGKPTTTKMERLTTAMGGEILNEKNEWQRKDSKAIINRYAGKITRCIVSFSSNANVTEMEKRYKKDIRNRSSDM